MTTLIKALAMAAAMCAMATVFSFTAEAEVIGDEDTRQRIGPNDTDHAAAVGMVYCEKTVMLDGVPKTYRNATTGTLVGNTKTVLSTVHGFQEHDSSGRLFLEYDYAKDCQYRKFQSGGRFYGYSFVHFNSGDYIGSGSDRSGDWAVLQLSGYAINQKAMMVRDLNENAVTPNSSHPIDIIAHHYDTDDDWGLYHSNGIMRSVTLNGNKEFAHTADTKGRASGAAIVNTDSSGVSAVYGIHIGSYHDYDLNRFIPITYEILEAIRDVMRH